jgi:Cytochrome C oxidase, cbb3-type, subunit III
MHAGDRPKLSARARKWWSAITCCAALVVATTATRTADADCQCGKSWPHVFCRQHGQYHQTGPGDISNVDMGGAWYWMRSPEQERRVVMSIYNRYCIRCHGVDGRGVWDIPDVPDFTNLTWQATRPDAYRTRVILEGRGAVMPAFRGTLTLEESCAMARYLHTFVPGSEVSRPDVGATGAGNLPAGSATAVKPAARPPVAPAPASPPVGIPSPFTR